MRVWLLAILWIAGGCASLFQNGPAEKNKSEPQEVSSPAPSIAPLASEAKENELKISRVWARMEELESELIRQKERMRLLERGLITGIVPDELAKGYDPSAESRAPEATAPSASAAPAPEMPTSEVGPLSASENASSVVEAPSLSPPVKRGDSLDEQSYQEKLSRAHALFGGSHWGQAIAAYGAIAQEFSESLTQGHPVYWIGMSWFHLKEYQLAEKQLTDFLNRFAESPLAPRAHFYLAKTEFQMGLVEKAVGRLRSLIRDFPADEAAKMAKLEITRLDQAL